MANWFDQFESRGTRTSQRKNETAGDDWFDQFDSRLTPQVPSEADEFGTPRPIQARAPVSVEDELGTPRVPVRDVDLGQLFGGRATVAEPSEKEKRRSGRYESRRRDRASVSPPVLESRPLTPTDRGWEFKDQKPATFGQSVGRGVDMMQSMVYGALEAVGEFRQKLPTLDERSRKAAEGLANIGREGRIRNEGQLQDGAPRSMAANIRSVGDFTQWAKEMVGEQIPIMGPIMAGGATGAAVGSAIPGLGTAVGGVVGAFIPAWMLGVGETQGAIKGADPDAVAPGWAFAGGTAVAALDSALPGKVGSTLVRTLGREAGEAAAKHFLLRPAENMVVRGAQGAITGLATEGVTEALQEAISGVTGAVATGTPIPETLPSEMFEAGAAGGLLGAGTAGVAALPAPQPEIPPDTTPPSPELVRFMRPGAEQAPPPGSAPDQQASAVNAPEISPDTAPDPWFDQFTADAPLEGRRKRGDRTEPDLPVSTSPATAPEEDVSADDALVDSVGEEWVTGVRPDTSGAAKYVVMIRAKDDPERSERGAHGPTEWRKLRKRPQEEVETSLLEHLSDGEPRTLNRIGVELWDQTADMIGGSVAEDALWSLVEQGRVEFTQKAPIKFRSVDGPGAESTPTPESAPEPKPATPQVSEPSSVVSRDGLFGREYSDRATGRPLEPGEAKGRSLRENYERRAAEGRLTQKEVKKERQLREGDTVRLPDGTEGTFQSVAFGKAKVKVGGSVQTVPHGELDLVDRRGGLPPQLRPKPVTPQVMEPPEGMKYVLPDMVTAPYKKRPEASTLADEVKAGRPVIVRDKIEAGKLTDQTGVEGTLEAVEGGYRFVPEPTPKKRTSEERANMIRAFRLAEPVSDSVLDRAARIHAKMMVDSSSVTPEERSWLKSQQIEDRFALKKNFAKQKRALKGALKTKDPKKILAAAQAGLASFEEHGYPDQWSDWTRAKDDAEAEIARTRTDLPSITVVESPGFAAQRLLDSGEMVRNASSGQPFEVVGKRKDFLVLKRPDGTNIEVDARNYVLESEWQLAHPAEPTQNPPETPPEPAARKVDARSRAFRVVASFLDAQESLKNALANTPENFGAEFDRQFNRAVQELAQADNAAYGELVDDPAYRGLVKAAHRQRLEAGQRTKTPPNPPVTPPSTTETQPAVGVESEQEVPSDRADDSEGRPDAGTAGDRSAQGDRDAGPQRVAGESPEAEAPVRDEPGTTPPGGARGEASDVRQDARGPVSEGSRDAGDSGGERGSPGNVDTAEGTAEPAKTAHARGQRPRHFVIEDADSLTSSGAGAKLQDNLAAIRLLKQLQQAGRRATADEQRTLARYIGWGHTGLNKVVDVREAWGNLTKTQQAAREELQSLLTPDEFQNVGESVVNAHYSFNLLPRTMWAIVQRLGFKGGSVLEPAVGTGHFFGTMPPAVASNKRTVLFGIDKEPIAAGIAQQLYQGAKIQASPIERASIPNEWFDVAISNVPFGQIPVFDPAFVSGGRKFLTSRIHNYYFGKALDSVRPGGLVAFITTRFTMDETNDSVRRYIAERADLVGAFRLPDTGFKKTAGTEVVTDVVILRKKDPGNPTPKGLIKPEDWMGTRRRDDLGYGGREFSTNTYFETHPEHILGAEDLTGKMYGRGGTYNVTGELTTEVMDRIIEAFPENVYRPSKTKPRKLAEPSQVDAKQGAYVLDKGKLFQLDQGTLVPSPLKGKDLDRAKSFIPLRDAYQGVLDAMVSDAPDADLAPLQKTLKSKYDAFVKRFGPVNARQNRSVIESDPNGPRILGLEDVATVTKPGSGGKGPRTVVVKKLSDIFTKRSVRHRKPPTSASSARDALAISLSWKGAVDVDYMSELTGSPIESITDELVGDIYFDPAASSWVSREEYLSGDVVTKLAQAEAASETNPALSGNVEALLAVQPEPLTAEQFSAPFGSTWVPTSVYERYFKEVANGTVNITLTNHEARTYFYVKGSGRHEALPAGYNFQKWVEDALNGKLPTINRPKDEGGGVDQAATDEYRQSLSQLRESWAEWWPDDPVASKELESIYNPMFNREVERDYDGSRLIIPNANPDIELRPWQKNAVWRILQSGNTLLNHAVGAGKTFAMSAAAGEMKRLGIASKPMIVVPNHLIEQWRRDFLLLYPDARVLVPDKKDFTPSRRRLLTARIANEDWDAIIMAQSQYTRISVSTERLTAFVKAQEEELLKEGAEQAGMSVEEFDALASSDTKDSKKKQRDFEQSTKDIIRTLLRLRTRLQRRLDQSKKDAPVMFEEIGVDALLIDEAHEYKSLFFMTAKNGIAGLSPSDSDRAIDMFLKTRIVNELSGSRGVVFATGTPITNAMSEVYTAFRYLAQPMLDRLGMAGFDSWANSYAEAVAQAEPLPGGGYKERTRLRNWSNLRELSKMFRQFTDVVSKDDLTSAKKPDGTPYLTLPTIKGGTRTTVALEPDAATESYMADLRDRIAELATGRVNPKDDNHLKVTTDASKAAVDLRLVDETAARNPTGRIAEAARRTLDIYKQTKADKGTQILFLDLGVPKQFDPLPDEIQAIEADEVVEDAEEEELSEEEAAQQAEEAALLEGVGNTDLYNDIKGLLIQGGVKPWEIAFVHQAETNEDKAKLFQAMRDGTVRVLLASTKKGATGMNVQDRLAAIHHVDVPWTPEVLEQREGRGIRQGNRNKEVEILQYVTKKSFDEYRWSVVARKQAFIHALYKGEVNEFEDVDPNQLDMQTAQALASGDERVLKIMDLERTVKNLTARQRNHQKTQRRAKLEVDQHQKQIERDEKSRDSYLSAAKTLAAWERAPTIEMTVEPGTYGFNDLPEPRVLDLSKEGAADTVKQAINGLMRRGAPYQDVTFGNAGPVSLVLVPHRVEVSREGALSIEKRVNIAGIIGPSVLFNSREWTPGSDDMPDIVPTLKRVLKAKQARAEAKKREGWIEEVGKRKAASEAVLGRPFKDAARLEQAEAELTELRQAVTASRAAETDARAKADDELDDTPATQALPPDALAPTDDPFQRGMPAPLQPASPVRKPTTVRPDRIVRDLGAALGNIPISIGKTGRQRGLWKRTGVIRTKIAGDYRAVLHEYGHGLDQLVGGWSQDRNSDAVVELEDLGKAFVPESASLAARRREGVAEYIARWLTEPDVIRPLAPNMTRQFEEWIASGHPVAKAVAEAQARTLEYLGLDPQRRLELFIDYGPGPIEKRIEVLKDAVIGSYENPQTGLSRLWASASDDLYRLWEMEGDLAGNRPIPVGDSVYWLNRLLKGTDGKALSFLEDRVRDRNGQTLGPGLERALEGRTHKYRQINEYLLARRAQRAADMGRLSGLTQDMIDSGLEHGNDPDVAEAVTIYDAFNDAKNQYLIDMGLLTPELLDKWEEVWGGAYVPYHRVEEAINGASTDRAGTRARLRQNSRVPWRRYRGAYSKVDDLIRSTVIDTFKAVSAAEENAAMLELIKAAGEPESGSWIERIPPDMEPTKFNLDQVRGEIIAKLEESGIKIEDSQKLDTEFLNAVATVWQPRQIAHGNKRYITAIENGTRVWAEIHDPGLWDLISKAGPQQTNRVVTLLRPGARLLRSTATLNAPFMVRNVVRDYYMASVMHPSGFTPKDWFGGLVSVWTGDDSWQLFQASKAAQSTFNAQDRDALDRKLRRMDMGTLRKWLDMTVMHPFDGLAALRELSELSTRVGAVKREMTARGILSDGVINEEKLDAAVMQELGVLGREITQDFQKMGSWVREYNQISAFLGARIGGYTRVMEETKAHPRRLTGRVLPYIALSVALWAWNRDDDEYDNIDGAERRAYHHLPVPQVLRDQGVGPFIRIARPFEFGDLSNYVEGFLDWKVAQDPEWRRRIPFAQDGDTLAFILQFAPDMFLPSIETVSNYSFYRRRPVISPFLTNLDPELQYSRWTSETAKRVGKALDVPPWQVDHMIYGHTAGVGRAAVRHLDQALAATGAAPPDPHRGPHDIPGLTAFYTGASLSMGGAFIGQFYEELDRLTGASASARRFAASGDFARASAIADEHGLTISKPRRRGAEYTIESPRLKRFRASGRRLSAMRSEIDKVYASRTMTPRQKRAALDKIVESMTNIARDAFGMGPMTRTVRRLEREKQQGAK